MLRMFLVIVTAPTYWTTEVRFCFQKSIDTICFGRPSFPSAYDRGRLCIAIGNCCPHSITQHSAEILEQNCWWWIWKILRDKLRWTDDSPATSLEPVCSVFRHPNNFAAVPREGFVIYEISCQFLE